MKFVYCKFSTWFQLKKWNETLRRNQPDNFVLISNEYELKDACHARCHFSMGDFEGNWTSLESLYCFSCLTFGGSTGQSWRNCAYFSAVWTQNIYGLTTYATAQYIFQRQFCGPTYSEKGGRAGGYMINTALK